MRAEEARLRRERFGPTIKEKVEATSVVVEEVGDDEDPEMVVLNRWWHHPHSETPFVFQTERVTRAARNEWLSDVDSRAREVQARRTRAEELERRRIAEANAAPPPPASPLPDSAK